MKKFECREIEEALAHSAAGGMALHVHSIIVDRKKAPKCFRDAVDRGEQIAHLFCRDEPRLVETARELGVRVILVERRGLPGQHIDLVGKPLRRALKRCGRRSLFD